MTHTNGVEFQRPQFPEIITERYMLEGSWDVRTISRRLWRVGQLSQGRTIKRPLLSFLRGSMGGWDYHNHTMQKVMSFGEQRAFREDMVGSPHNPSHLQSFKPLIPGRYAALQAIEQSCKLRQAGTCGFVQHMRTPGITVPMSVNARGG